MSSLWGSVSLDREVLRPEVDDDEIRSIALATAPSIGVYGAMLALAFFVPRVAIVGYLVIAIIALLRMRGDSIRPAHPPLSSRRVDRKDPLWQAQSGEGLLLPRQVDAQFGFGVVDQLAADVDGDAVQRAGERGTAPA